MARDFTTALVAALVLGSAGIASARKPSIEHYDGWTYPQSERAVLLSAQLAVRTTTPRNKVTPEPRRSRSSKAAHRSARRPAFPLPAAIPSTRPIRSTAWRSSVSRSKANIRRNCDARTGDKLILTKSLGVGIYSAAFKKAALGRATYDDFIATTTLAESRLWNDSSH